MSIPRGGFWPVRHLNGNGSFQTQRLAKETGANDASLLYVGDPVRIVSGKVQRYLSTDVSSSVAPPVAGVAARILRDAAGRPRVHGLPDQHPNISLTADADYVDFYSDYGIVFATKAAGNVSAASINTVVNVTTTARITACGISGTIIANAAVSADRGPFVITEVSDFDIDNQENDTGGRIGVVMNYNIWKNQPET